MNKYELLLIIENELTDDKKEAVIEKISSAVTAAQGTVDSVDKWGTKKYAYPINFKNEGYYVLVNFTAPASVPAEIDRLVNIMDETVRCMIIRK